MTEYEAMGLRKLLGPFGPLYAQMYELILRSYGTDMVPKEPKDYKPKK